MSYIRGIRDFQPVDYVDGYSWDHYSEKQTFCLFCLGYHSFKLRNSSDCLKVTSSKYLCSPSITLSLFMDHSPKL